LSNSSAKTYPIAGVHSLLGLNICFYGSCARKTAAAAIFTHD
jgi:hypothetical protein